MTEEIRVKVEELQNFIADVFQHRGLTENDAQITAEVLVLADRRGIESHGVARLQRYVDDLKRGVIRAETRMTVVRETPVSLVVDGNGGMGQPLTHAVMTRCIAKARQNYMCFATIRNSNHYGIAGYYVLMALKENMIGIAMTNTAPLVVPTFGRDVVIGTNPIAIGFPSKRERPFLLDMATSTVPRGKLEVYARKEEPIPDSWACGADGLPSTDPVKMLDLMINRGGGGLLPLGGATELTSGHKGYGLSAMVDILCGGLSSGALGTDVYGKKNAPAEVAHFVGAINPAAFLGLDDLQRNIDYYMQMLKNAAKAAGQTRIFVAGEKEYEAEERNRITVPLEPKVFTNLNRIGQEYDLTLAAA